MKRILAFLLFSAIVNWGFSQNWKPLNPTEKFNYTIDEEEVYSTIWADSSKIINSDSVYYLNKIVLPCPDCGFDYAYLMNQCSFLLSEIKFFYDGTYRLSWHDSLYINPLAGLNESWLFDSTNNITAEIISIGDSSIFGQIDSIKTIALSNDRIIKISKQHGILLFPVITANGTMQYSKLCGIEGRDLGFVTPNFEDFFGYDVGDVFEYYITTSEHPYNFENLKQATISEKHIVGDSIVFKTNSKGYYFSPGPAFVDTTYYSNEVETLFYINSSDHFLNGNIYQLVGNVGQVWTPDGCGWSQLEYQNSFGQFAKNKESMNLQEYSGDTLRKAVEWWICELEESFTFAEKIGLVSYYYAEPDGMFGYYHHKDLNGCIVDGQLYGTLTPDSLLTPVITHNSFDVGIETFPNPTNNLLTLKINYHEVSEYNIRIYNISAKEVLRMEYYTNEITIDLSSLDHGIYLVEISGPGWNVLKKVVKIP